MLKRAICLGAMLAASALSAPAQAQGAPAPLTDPAALTTLLSDRTLHGRYSAGLSFTEYYAPDGRTAYWERGCLHSGKWWIAALPQPFGTFPEGLPTACFSYPTLDEGKGPSCFAVAGPAGGEQFYQIAGDPARAGSIPAALAQSWSSGNPDGLKLDEDNCPSS